MQENLDRLRETHTICLMHTVCETPWFSRAALKVGMTEREVAALIDHLASNPLAGDVMEGTGGCRKVRWAAPGRGKSGGYRTITFYSGKEVPVFLLTVFAKNVRANLTKADRNELGILAKALAEHYASKVVKVSGTK